MLHCSYITSGLVTIRLHLIVTQYCLCTMAFVIYHTYHFQETPNPTVLAYIMKEVASLVKKTLSKQFSHHTHTYIQFQRSEISKIQQHQLIKQPLPVKSVTKRTQSCDTHVTLVMLIKYSLVCTNLAIILQDTHVHV